MSFAARPPDPAHLPRSEARFRRGNVLHFEPTLHKQTRDFLIKSNLLELSGRYSAACSKRGPKFHEFCIIAPHQTSREGAMRCGDGNACTLRCTSRARPRRKTSKAGMCPVSNKVTLGAEVRHAPEFGAGDPPLCKDATPCAATWQRPDFAGRRGSCPPRPQNEPGMSFRFNTWSLRVLSEGPFTRPRGWRSSSRSPTDSASRPPGCIVGPRSPGEVPCLTLPERGP